MAKCKNPNCNRDHEFEAKLAAEIATIAYRRCKDAGQSSDTLIAVLAAATMSTTFGLAKPGQESEALQDTVSMVIGLAMRLLGGEETMQLKASMDAKSFLDRAVREAGGHHG